jgi:hypothetical protein
VPSDVRAKLLDMSDMIEPSVLVADVGERARRADPAHTRRTMSAAEQPAVGSAHAAWLTLNIGHVYQPLERLRRDG